MRTIETIVTVVEGGSGTLRLPLDIPPGDHKVVVVLEDTVKKPVTHVDDPWKDGPENIR